ncbi:MAG: GTP-binding protein [Clostridia bacterium]
MIPAYIINGFLESGKTEFLNFTLVQDYFKLKGTTLLIACEEGELEYDTDELLKHNTVVEYIEDKEDFTIETLIALEKKHNAKRIMIEWNGVWDCRNIELPENWELQQQISLVNASTFELYYSNMRSIMMEMLKNSELILFNRCDDLESKLSAFKRSVRLVNQNANIIFEGEEGEISVFIEEDMPYDLNAETIELTDENYLFWCMDCIDNAERYVGKKLHFIAQVYKNPKIPKGHMVLGRRVMTCCDDDIEFLGFPCKSSLSSSYSDKEWVNVTVVFEMQNCFAYSDEGPLLKLISINKTKTPKNEVI